MDVSEQWVPCSGECLTPSAAYRSGYIQTVKWHKIYDERGRSTSSSPLLTEVLVPKYLFCSCHGLFHLAQHVHGFLEMCVEVPPHQLKNLVNNRVTN